MSATLKLAGTSVLKRRPSVPYGANLYMSEFIVAHYIVQQ